MAAATIDVSLLALDDWNRTAHRRLDPQLKRTDLRLQAWATWAKPSYGLLGYPVRSITEKANEGGILARNTAPHPPEWPAPVVEVETRVAAFPIRHLAAIMAYYFHMALTAELRQQRYVEIARKLALTRPCDPRSARSLGKGAFAHDLDRARWTLKFALRL